MERYAIALGSNRASGRHVAPRQVIGAALARLRHEVRVVAVSPLIDTPALGPSSRRFANGAALIETDLAPLTLLSLLKRIERSFGRRRGRRWGARPIDLDILLWSGGRFDQPDLRIPHAHLPARDFVLVPLMAIAPDWTMPGTGFRVRHLHARLTRWRARG